MQYSGRAYISVNGTLLETAEGATFDPGGVVRKTVQGSAIYGFQEELKESKVSCKIKVRAGMPLSVKDLKAIKDASVLFQTDDGLSFSLNHAWNVDAGPLDATAGEIPAEFAAADYDEV